MFIFLKLGGSLITDKTRPYTARQERLADLSRQIAAALHADPGLSLVIGHGSGSFGHQAAREFGTRHGVSGKAAWHGFSEVWYQASALNRLVVAALHEAGLPAVTISPFSTVRASDGVVKSWDLTTLEAALEHNLLPVVHGDVIFDEMRGGTILSTEDLFLHLARQLRPQRVLLAGLEDGVWKDFPACTELLPEIDAETPLSGLGAARGADVTGGMRAKVEQMLALVKEIPALEVLIFSGEQPGTLQRALAGECPGTRIVARPAAHAR